MTVSITVKTPGHCRARVTAADTLPDGQAGAEQFNDMDPNSTYDTCVYPGRTITVTELPLEE